MDGEDGQPGTNGTNGVDGVDGQDGARGDPGLRWRGGWDETVAYDMGDVVELNGSVVGRIRKRS